MARPTRARSPAQHIEVLGKMLRQVEVDAALTARRRAALQRQIGDLIVEFRREMIAVVDGSKGGPKSGVKGGG